VSYLTKRQTRADALIYRKRMPEDGGQAPESHNGRRKGVPMKIGTIASHSALNILSGAKAEGFDTVLFCTPDRLSLYGQFGFKDSLVKVDAFDEILDMDLSDVVLIPHGSFVAYIGADRICQSNLRVFGSKDLLRWEESRDLKAKLMKAAGFRVPKEFTSPKEVDRAVIVKTHGAAGGEGYFIGKTGSEVKSRMDPSKQYSIQEYVVGTKIYVTFFNSLARKRTEVFGADIRYETDADANLRFDDNPSFVVVGNLPVVLRESTLAEYFEMGHSFVEAFRRLTECELPGPFCLETIIDREQQIYTFEFSGRIVAGTNVWIPYSPYSFLQFGEQMWMGRRIAREIRELMDQKRLDDALQ
jgi:5-formaminoimidazole-4-carboxamide-1-(beta)-D-ribofuranosyl 5'-monophosphate synthetase